MKTIEIQHNQKAYSVNITYLPGWPNGYYKIEWNDKELLKSFSPPVFIGINEDKLSLPPFKNIDEATFLMSLAMGILMNAE